VTVWHWLQHRPLLYRWLPVAAWMGLIFFLSAQPDLPHAEIGWADMLISSGAHAFVFGVLALLWARVLGEGRWTLPAAFALTALYALSDEFHQAFVPGRHPDALDLLCDACGAMLGLWALAWWRRRSARTLKNGL
jgi:VanZ family protein